MDAHLVRVIVRLPYNRPEHPQPDPVPVSPSNSRSSFYSTANASTFFRQVSWNSDKEKYLWEVVAKSRGSESGAPDCECISLRFTEFPLTLWLYLHHLAIVGKVLAARLDVPLPYLLYRAQVRYEHDLRGLQVIKGSLSPNPAHDGTQNAEAPLDDTANLPSFPRRFPGAGRRDSLSRLSTSVRLTAPLGVRARLNSLTSNSPSRTSRPASSSVLTLRGGHRRDPTAFRPASPLSSESETDDEYERREEAERRLEEEEALDKKLKNLQTLLTGDNVGLVSSVSEHGKAIESQTSQGRFAPSSPPQRARTDASVSSRSQSISSASSPRGSIPSMPSPTPESPQSVTSKHTSRSSPANPAGPSATTSQAKAQPLLRYGPATAGSSASSFSDLSGSCRFPLFSRWQRIISFGNPTRSQLEF